MRLFEAIVAANHSATRGDQNASLQVSDFNDALPVVALTCIDPRLNRLLPDALGIPDELFIWLRNAGNIITGPLSSTMRSLALACAVKGGKEIAIIGHSDCLVCKSTVLSLTDRLKALGVERSVLPENLTEYFGLFASERQNVQKAAEHVRSSPLIGAKVPVHGCLIDLASGRLEWLVNGYENIGKVAPISTPQNNPLAALADFAMGEMKFPDLKIGQIVEAVETLAQPGGIKELAKAALTEVISSKKTEKTEKADPNSPARVPPPIVPLIRRVQKAYGSKDD